MTTPHLKKSIGRSSSRLALLLIPLVFACLALSPTAQAQLSPTPDGLYPGANVAEGGAGALHSLTTGTNNTALGSQALFSLTTGKQNTATGAQALKVNTADQNTADGFQALNKNTTGTANAASGWRALFQNTTGVGNTADGHAAVYSNTTGIGNTGVGQSALFSNREGAFNTAIGTSALVSNVGNGDIFEDSEGNANTAVGATALAANVTGTDNCAVGASALLLNTTGDNNVAVGSDALNENTTGISNVAVGSDALNSCTDGVGNIAIGEEALDECDHGDYNIAIGDGAGRNVIGTSPEHGTENILLGFDAGFAVTDANNVICIGAEGANVSGTTYIDGIRGKTTQNNDATPVLIDSAGQLGTASSSRRYKTDIKPIDKASESILALKPVSFRYKVHKDSTPQFGLIAEEVAGVNPDLVIYDADGKPYTVRYEAVNAMLLNEFLKEHKAFVNEQHKVERLEATVAQQHKDFEAAVVELRGQIQKVSAQLEVSKPARRTVLNNP